MKKLAYQKIIPILAALALLGGCSSIHLGRSSPYLSLPTRPDPENPDAPPYVEVEFDGIGYNEKIQIDIDKLYFQNFRKLVAKNVQLAKVYNANDHREQISSPTLKKIAGTKLLVTDELSKAYPNLRKQIEYGRRYDLWLQLKREAFIKGDKKTHSVVAYVKDIEGLRSVEEIEADRARRAAEEEERVALAERIIVKKYGSLFSSYSDYANWMQRQWQNGDQFMKSLLLNQDKTYYENDRFIVKKHKLEIKGMQLTAGGGFAYLVGGLGHVGGYSRPCYLISETQIPYTTARAMITKDLLLEYIGEEQYREGYQVKTCDVFLAFVEGSSEYEDFQNMIDDLLRIEQSPGGYAYILDE